MQGQGAGPGPGMGPRPMQQGPRPQGARPRPPMNQGPMQQNAPAPMQSQGYGQQQPPPRPQQYGPPQGGPGPQRPVGQGPPPPRAQFSQGGPSPNMGGGGGGYGPGGGPSGGGGGPQYPPPRPNIQQGGGPGPQQYSGPPQQRPAYGPGHGGPPPPQQQQQQQAPYNQQGGPIPPPQQRMSQVCGKSVLCAQEIGGCAMWCRRQSANVFVTKYNPSDFSSLSSSFQYGNQNQYGGGPGGYGPPQGGGMQQQQQQQRPPPQPQLGPGQSYSPGPYVSVVSRPLLVPCALLPSRGTACTASLICTVVLDLCECICAFWLIGVCLVHPPVRASSHRKRNCFFRHRPANYGSGGMASASADKVLAAKLVLLCCVSLTATFTRVLAHAVIGASLLWSDTCAFAHPTRTLMRLFPPDRAQMGRRAVHVNPRAAYKFGIDANAVYSEV